MKNMKNRIFDHLGLKIISLLIAIVVWVIVANVDDYKTTKKITGIEIEFINGESITDNNMVYEVPEGTTIDIVVKGRRKVVDNLTSLDFRAVADLSKMSVTNAVSVIVSANNSLVGRDISISYAGNDAVNIAVEKKIESQLAINVRTSSDVAEGYAIRSKLPTPNLITVKGAESVIDMINEVVVDVDVTGANCNLTATAVPVFLSKSGEAIDPNKFEYDIKSVDVMVEIAKTKELAVRVKTTGDVKEGYGISGVDYQPTSILVVGAASDLAKVDEIIIDDIDVSNMMSNMETSVRIEDYLPDGITIADNTEEIMIKVGIEKFEEKSLVLSNDAINIVGKNKDLTYSFNGDTSNSLRLMGLKDDLDAVSITNLIPSIDVTGYGPGNYTFNVSLKDVTGVQILDDIKVDIEIKEN